VVHAHGARRLALRGRADFAAQLPLTLTLTDYAATEKVGDLPRKLTTKGAPEGAAARAGDIGYYAPRANLAL